MRIVLLNQFFWPNTVATAQLLSDAAQELSREHEVTVICSGSPRTSREIPGDEFNIEIIRTRGWKFSHRWPARVASYAAYLAGTVWHCCRVKRPDVFVTMTTPPFLSTIGSLFGLLRGTRHVIWEMDVYPDIATDLGYFKHGGIADRVTGAILDWSRRRAESIIVLGEEMKLRLVARGVGEKKIYVAENWADGSEIQPQPAPDGPLVVEYAGNLGLAHEIETVASVIERLANRSSVRFVFAGGGPRRQEFEAACRARGLRNVDFKPYCSRSELSKRLGEGHIGLVTQVSETRGSIVPSKIYGILASGRPLLYVGPTGTTPSHHISNFNCGWQVLPGDVDGLEALLLYLDGNRHLVSAAGAKGRVAFEQNFDRSIAVQRILRIIAVTDHSKELLPELSQSVIGE